MGYADGHPIRAVGGRLALDFLNTADWSADGAVVHEKLERTEDLELWARTFGFDEPLSAVDLDAAKKARAALRASVLDALAAGKAVDGPTAYRTARQALGALMEDRGGLFDAIAASAFALLCDRRERVRLKQCPGVDCGWLFVDETRNGRRRWCMMETCGNRSKARRSYARRRARAPSSSP